MSQMTKKQVKMFERTQKLHLKILTLYLQPLNVGITSYAAEMAKAGKITKIV